MNDIFLLFRFSCETSYPFSMGPCYCYIFIFLLNQLLGGIKLQKNELSIERNIKSVVEIKTSVYVHKDDHYSLLSFLSF